VVTIASPTRDSVATTDLRRFRIVGAGPTGALLALGLARQGHSVDLIDALPRQALLDRSRAYAMTHSSRRLLQRLELWSDLSPELTPFTALRLDDRATHQTAWFTLNDLNDANRKAEAIGWILDHRPLMRLLLDRLEQSPRVALRFGVADNAPCASPASVSGEWMIAADGPRSLLRERSGVLYWSHRYQQGCLTAKVRLRGAEPFTAYELFRPEGPMAVLPLGEDRYQVVWSAPISLCRDRAGSNSMELLSALTAILPEELSVTELLDRPGAFPLELSFAPRLDRHRLLLVGESGHRCHPVGGQGLNLCWRDVSDLLDLTQQLRDGVLTSRALPRRYTRRRRLDLLTVLLATDLLIRFFSNRHLLLLPLRRLALVALAQLGWLRRLSLSAMTDGPGTLLRSLPE